MRCSPMGMAVSGPDMTRRPCARRETRNLLPNMQFVPAPDSGTIRSMGDAVFSHRIREMEIAWQIRHAARQLARTPSFTLISLATLSLAIGATTAVFTVVNGVLLKPLEFERPDRLVFLHDISPTGAEEPIAPQDLTDYRDQTHSFTDVVAIDPAKNPTLIRPSASPARVRAARVSATFFSLLGVKAELGRTFAVGEDAKTAPRVVVLSDGAWKRYFASDPSIVGKQRAQNPAVPGRSLHQPETRGALHLYSGTIRWPAPGASSR
jgi:hypothetical protein